jgi:hypothetical protein
MMTKFLLGAAICLAISGVATIAWADPATPSSRRPPADPNQKVCEDITMVGSRLATKRICASRAEWEAKKKESKDDVERMQREIKLQCQQGSSRSGGPPTNC